MLTCDADIQVEAATKTLAADLVASRGVGDDVAQLQVRV